MTTLQDWSDYTCPYCESRAIKVSEGVYPFKWTAYCYICREGDSELLPEDERGKP